MSLPPSSQDYLFACAALMTLMLERGADRLEFDGGDGLKLVVTLVFGDSHA